MKSIEQAIRDKILYIGNEIPESLMNDKRDKFFILGTPQELIDEVTLPSELDEHHWTKEELDKHIQINCKEDAGSYSMVVVLAALYMKLYGKGALPDIGLSGFQGETAEKLSDVFPTPL